MVARVNNDLDHASVHGSLSFCGEKSLPYPHAAAQVVSEMSILSIYPSISLPFSFPLTLHPFLPLPLPMSTPMSRPSPQISLPPPRSLPAGMTGTCRVLSRVLTSRLSTTEGMCLVRTIDFCSGDEEGRGQCLALATTTGNGVQEDGMVKAPHSLRSCVWVGNLRGRVMGRGDDRFSV